MGENTYKLYTYFNKYQFKETNEACIAVVHTGVYIFLFGGDMVKYHVGGKKWLKGDEKRGGNAYFFPPNWLNIHKIKFTKKSLKFFPCGAHHLIIIYFLWGKTMNQERSERNVTPDLYYKFYEESLISWMKSRMLVSGVHWSYSPLNNIIVF